MSRVDVVQAHADDPLVLIYVRGPVSAGMACMGSSPKPMWLWMVTMWGGSVCVWGGGWVGGTAGARNSARCTCGVGCADQDLQRPRAGLRHGGAACHEQNGSTRAGLEQEGAGLPSLPVAHAPSPTLSAVRVLAGLAVYPSPTLSAVRVLALNLLPLSPPPCPQLVDLYFWGPSKDLYVEEGTLLGTDEVIGKVFLGKPGFALGSVPLETLGLASGWLPSGIVRRVTGATPGSDGTASAAGGPAAAGTEAAATPASGSVEGAGVAAPVTPASSSPAATAPVAGTTAPASQGTPLAASETPLAADVGSGAKEDGAPSVASPADADGPAEASGVILLGDKDDSVAASDAPESEVPGYVDTTAETFEQIMTARIRPKMPVRGVCVVCVRLCGEAALVIFVGGYSSAPLETS
jgi:hypothetical protein